MLQIILRFELSWLLILPLDKLDETQIHCLGDKLAGEYVINDRRTLVLYKSSLLQPIKFKHVEN